MATQEWALATLIGRHAIASTDLTTIAEFNEVHEAMRTARLALARTQPAWPWSEMSEPQRTWWATEAEWEATEDDAPEDAHPTISMQDYELYRISTDEARRKLATALASLRAPTYGDFCQRLLHFEDQTDNAPLLLPPAAGSATVQQAGDHSLFHKTQANDIACQHLTEHLPKFTSLACSLVVWGES